MHLFRCCSLGQWNCKLHRCRIGSLPMSISSFTLHRMFTYPSRNKTTLTTTMCFTCRNHFTNVLCSRGGTVMCIGEFQPIFFVFGRSPLFIKYMQALLLCILFLPPIRFNAFEIHVLNLATMFLASMTIFPMLAPYMTEKRIEMFLFIFIASFPVCYDFKFAEKSAWSVEGAK